MGNLTPDPVDTVLDIKDRFDLLESLGEKAKNMIVPASACSLDLPHRIGDAIEHDRHQYDRNSALKRLANVESLHTPEHDISESRRGDKCR